MDRRSSGKDRNGRGKLGHDQSANVPNVVAAAGQRNELRLGRHSLDLSGSARSSVDHLRGRRP
jgi:hypothetical protein